MSLGVLKPGSESLSWGEMLEEWQKLWGRGERSFLMGLGWQAKQQCGGWGQPVIRVPGGRGQRRLGKGGGTWAGQAREGVGLPWLGTSGVGHRKT